MIAPGYCQCGCGGNTTIARYTNKQKGEIKGAPHRFIRYHHSRLQKGEQAHHHTHCKSNTPEWRVWRSMRQRCEDPNCSRYPFYGAMGITVCERWSSFESFLEDMGCKPSRRHQIDRIDNTKGYEPGNCRWVTPKQQARNRRKNSRNTTGYKGVSFHGGRTRPYQACIYPNGKTVFLGYFKTKEEAALAYNGAAKEYYGEFANLNNI